MSGGCGNAVIASGTVGAICDFERIASAAFIGIVAAVAGAVVTGIGVVAITRIRGGSVIVAGTVVLATRHFVLVANLIAVRVHEAVAVAVIAGGCEGALAIIVGCGNAVIAS